MRHAALWAQTDFDGLSANWAGSYRLKGRCWRLHADLRCGLRIELLIPRRCVLDGRQLTNTRHGIVALQREEWSISHQCCKDGNKQRNIGVYLSHLFGGRCGPGSSILREKYNVSLGLGSHILHLGFPLTEFPAPGMAGSTTRLASLLAGRGPSRELPREPEGGIAYLMVPRTERFSFLSCRFLVFVSNLECLEVCHHRVRK